MRKKIIEKILKYFNRVCGRAKCRVKCENPNEVIKYRVTNKFRPDSLLDHFQSIFFDMIAVIAFFMRTYLALIALCNRSPYAFCCKLNYYHYVVEN